MIRSHDLHGEQGIKPDIGVSREAWGGGLPVPFNPCSCPIFVSFLLFSLFPLQNIKQCCVCVTFSCFSRLSPSWGIPLPAFSFPASRSLPAPFPDFPPPAPPPPPIKLISLACEQAVLGGGLPTLLHPR